MRTSIKTSELESLLMATPRSSFISLTAVTEPDMRKRHNPYCSQNGRRWDSHVRKVSILSGALINCSYDNVVDQRRLKEHLSANRPGRPGGRRRNPRAWGRHVDHSPLVTHTVAGEARIYLHTIVQRRFDHFFDDRDNERIPVAELEDWLNERDTGFRHQKLNQPVIVKDWTLSNVAELTLNRQRYRIAPAVHQLDAFLPRTKPTAKRQARRERQVATDPAAGAMF